MSLGSLVRHFWTHPLARKLNVESSNSISVHREILLSKPLLKACYLHWYQEFLPAYTDTSKLSGDVVEIGCGAGFFEEVVPTVLKTDSVSNPYASQIMNAMEMSYGDNEVRAIYMAGVLHHIPSPAAFLREAERCLRPGGRLVMIEPNNNAFERFLCKFLNHYEYFDDTVQEWDNRSSTRMDDANLAIPWVIFVRDREIFQRQFPRLRIKAIRYHTFLSYLISGGMTFKAFAPAWSQPILKGIEVVTRPLMKILGTSMTIDIEKV